MKYLKGTVVPIYKYIKCFKNHFIMLNELLYIRYKFKFSLHFYFTNLLSFLSLYLDCFVYLVDFNTPPISSSHSLLFTQMHFLKCTNVILKFVCVKEESYNTTIVHRVLILKIESYIQDSETSLLFLK